MPKGKWINKKNATTFQLVHRPQNDPLIHDESAPQMVLNPVQQRVGSHKSKQLDDLASELGSEAESIRANEGEAASYGIYYDDSEYDYMQHLRDLNAGGGSAVWIEATDSSPKKGKGKSLEVALKEMEVHDKSKELLSDDMLPSQNLQRLTYQSQQDVPDSISGFQPDLDPRLREVLEALEDEAYVDDDDDDIFQELAKDAKELNEHEFEEQDYDDDGEDGWESDDTMKPEKEFKDEVPQLVDTGAGSNGHVDTQPQDWMEDFNQFKKNQKTTKSHPVAAGSELQSSIWTTSTNGGRHKKRKGALTNPSSYSMTSSSLVRTEQMDLLDKRFEKLQDIYEGDAEDEGEDGMSAVSALSTTSSVQGPTRGDFDGILDDFLGNFTRPSKRTSKKARAQSGLEQLEEIRRDLGPARIRSRT